MNYINLLRPKSWIKNILVFAALLFSGEYTHTGKLTSTFTIFIGFCSLSSAIYIFNDWVDREKDKLHPIKSERPIASGSVTGYEASALSVFLLVIVGISLIVIPLSTKFEVAVTYSLYLAIMLGYNLGLKNFFGIDILIVASGYVLRAISGGVGIDVPITNWFLLTIFFVCLLLITGKRRADIKNLSEATASEFRPVLNLYSEKLLDTFITITATASLLTYALYTLSNTGGQRISRVGMPVTVIFVVYGIFRYLFLLYVEDKGGAPEKLFFQDRQLQLCIIFWAGFILLLQNYDTLMQGI